MSGIASSPSSSAVHTTPSVSSPSSGGSVAAEPPDAAAPRDHSVRIGGTDAVLHASDGGVALKIDNGPWMDLPGARIVLEGSNLFIQVNGQLLTVEKAFGLHAGNAEPPSGTIVVPSPGRPQPAPGDTEQVPPTYGTGEGTQSADDAGVPRPVLPVR